MNLLNKNKNYIFIILFLLFITYLYFMDPSKKGLYPPCPFYYITGYYCAGCGTLRALHSLLHGKILLAFSYNVLSVMSIPLVIYLLLCNLNITIKGKRLQRHLFSKKFYIAFIFIIFLFWIIRNIPYYPFTLLAP